MPNETIQDQALRRFRQTAEAWAAYVERASIVAIGVKTSGGLKLISGRIQLFRADVDISPDLQVETEHVFGRRQFIACTSDTAIQLVNEAINGRISFESPNNSFDLSTGSLRVTSHPIRPSGVPADVRLPTCRVSGNNKYSHLEACGGLETADWELRANDPPYYSLDDLLSSFGLPVSNAMGDFAQLEVQIVPPAIILGDLSKIRDGRAEVLIWGSPKLNSTNVSVSVKGFPRAGSSITARTLEFAGTVRPEGRAYDAMRFVGDVRDEAAVRVFLNVNGLAINQFWIDDPSRRLHAALVGVEAFDESLSALDQYLFNCRGDQAERLEWAVGNLLYLLGFRVLRLGKGTPVTDGPDLLAVTPSGHVAIVECTLGHPDNKDKVAKVLQRAARVRDRLNKSGFSQNLILPVVVTPVPREELHDAHADSLRRGALILDKQNLLDLRQRARFPQNPDQILNEGVSALSGRDSLQG